MFLTRILHKRLQFYRHSWLFSLPDIYTKVSSMQENELENLILNFFDYDANYECFKTSSGRTSLEIVLRVLKDIPKYKNRDEVIVPSYACRGVIDPILNAGLKPIFVDIDRYLMPDRNEIFKKISSSTLACYVHNIFGNDAFDQSIYNALLEKDAILLDDHCQSLYLPKKKFDNVISFFSFCYGKTLPATCGGAIVTRDFKDEIREFFTSLPEEPIENSLARFNHIIYSDRSLKEHIRRRVTGISKPRTLPNTQYELRKMNLLDASMIIMQWSENAEKFENQKINYNNFSKHLNKIEGIQIANTSCSSKETLPLVFESELMKVDFSNHFFSKNIELSELYTPLHTRLTEYNLLQDLPMTNSIYKRVIGFPIRPNLETCESNFILKTLKEYGEKVGRNK